MRTQQFREVLADPDTRALFGSHILGRQASPLLQPLVQAMCLDNTVDEMATVDPYVLPALSEAVEQRRLSHCDPTRRRGTEVPRPGEWPHRGAGFSTVGTHRSADLVTVYWRPGCPSCAVLRRGLRSAGLVTAEVNIWTDPEAAATVRSIAGGNETVPTVVVAGRGLVNPKVGAVLDAARTAAPDLVVDKAAVGGVRRANVAVLQWVVIIALVVASFAVEAAGHAGASWVIDGVNLVIYRGFRVARRRLQRTRAPETGTGGTP